MTTIMSNSTFGLISSIIYNVVEKDIEASKGRYHSDYSVCVYNEEKGNIRLSISRNNPDGLSIFNGLVLDKENE